MRIPTYRAQVSPTGEAPGQPIRTRYNANIAVQSQLDKAKPLNAALQEIGEFARVRYEMARDNLLNEATLAADEKIFEAYRDLKDSKDFNRVLDGDNPLWNQRMQKVKTDLQKTLGKDKYSNSKFNAYFNQSELRNRFKLRGVIDTRVKQAAVQYRNMQNQNFAKTHGNKDGNINDVKNDLVLLDVNASRLASHKVKNQSFFDYSKMSKQSRSTLMFTAERALVDYAFNADNLSSMQVIENVVDAVVNNQKTADNSYTTQLLSLIAQTEGKDAAINIIRKVASDSQFVDKITNNLPSDIRKAKINELEVKTNEYQDTVDNLGNYQFLDENVLEELIDKGSAFKEIATGLGSKSIVNDIDRSLNKINRKITDKAIFNEFNQIMPVNHQAFYEKYEKDQKTANGVANFETAKKIVENYNKELSQNENNVVGFSLEKFGEDYQLATNQVMPNISFDELSQPPTDATRAKVQSLKNFAVWTQNNVKRSENMQVLPRSIINKFTDVQARSNRLGDLTSFQNLFDHFQSVDLYDEVLMQLGESPALLAVGDLIQRNKTEDANLILSGVNKLSDSKDLVVSDLRNSEIHSNILSQVFDTNTDVGRSTVRAYSQAAQAHQIAKFDAKIYDIDNYDGNKDLRKERIKLDALDSINAVLGISLGPDSNQYGGIQEINNSLMLVPDAFTADDVEHFISNLNNGDIINSDESMGLTVDPNTLRDIRGGGDFEFKPISASEGSNLYVAFKREQDGQLTLVSLFRDKVETDVHAVFDFNTINLGIKYTENPDNNLSVIQEQPIEGLEDFDLRNQQQQFELPSFTGN